MAGSASIVILIAVLIAAVLVGVGGGSSAQAVILEPAAQSGADPFTASVQIGPAISLSQPAQAVTVAARDKLVEDPKTHTLIAPASAPGLYGGSGDTHVCDPNQLVAFLQQHPGKAAAWAAVLGVNAGDIKTYVASLTPVVLTNDTLVTNHGYRDGHATTLTSVLQAGTAVMIDGYGVPRVKCNCGNPLTPPQPINPADFRGHAWAGYAPTQVTVVHSSTQITNITVINVTTGTSYSQPTGTTPTQLVAGTFTQGSNGRTTVLTSRDGAQWKAVTTLDGLVHGFASAKGTWIAFRQNYPTGTEVIESTDLKTWTTVTTVPDILRDATYANGRWIAVGNDIVRGSSDEMANEFPPAAVYSSADGHAWTRIASLDHAPPFTSVAFASGAWIAVGNGMHEWGSPSVTYRSTDGRTWTQQDSTSLQQSESQGALAFGNGRWVLGGLDVSPNQSTGNDGVISTSSDSVRWTAVARFPRSQIAGLVFSQGKWFALAVTGDVLSSADGRTWSKVGSVPTEGSDLAAGGS
jgi:hypothetical protein